MAKIRYDSFLISKLLIVFAMAGFFIIFFLALRSPTFYQPEWHQQLVKIEPVNPVKDADTTIYQTALSDNPCQRCNHVRLYGHAAFYDSVLSQYDG